MSGPRYTSFKKVAAGGMAELHLGVAEHNSGFKKIVAIKKILPQHAGNQNYIDFMRAEARIGATLQNAAIVNVYGFDRVEGSDALIMEYVQGVDLETLLKKCRRGALPLSKPMALFIASEIARALAFVHGVRDQLTNREMVIIHADVTPSNILISYEGEVKLSDFGVACARLSGDAELPDGLRGKPSYMAPEQIRGQRITAATDIFSLGCVLFEMIAGRRLFDANIANPNRFDVLDPANIDATLASSMEPIDSALKEIITRCLAVEPSRRFTKTADLESSLVETLQSQYGSFTRQRLSTFLKSIFSKEIKQLNDTITAALNTQVEHTAMAPSAEEALGLIAKPGLPPPPRRQGPPPSDLRPESAAPVQQFAAGSVPPELSGRSNSNLSAPQLSASQLAAVQAQAQAQGASGHLVVVLQSDGSTSEACSLNGGGGQFKLHRGVDLTAVDQVLPDNILPSRSTQQGIGVPMPAPRASMQPRPIGTARPRPNQRNSIAQRTIAEPVAIARRRTSPLAVIFVLLLIVTIGAVSYTYLAPNEGNPAGLTAKPLKKHPPAPSAKRTEEK